MKLNRDSVIRLLGDPAQSEVLVYGFADCDYNAVCYKLEKMGYKSYDYRSFPYKSVFTYSGGFKGQLDNMVIENYRRYHAGQPLITAVFMIGKENPNKKIILDINKLALSRDMNSITDHELRRVYKYHERINASQHQDFKEAFEKNIKFVKLTFKNDEYLLEEIKPFWTQQEWIQLWQERSKIVNGHGKWSDIINNCLKITLFNNPSHGVESEHPSCTSLFNANR
jgi:hypothetical protein